MWSLWVQIFRQLYSLSLLHYHMHISYQFTPRHYESLKEDDVGFIKICPLILNRNLMDLKADECVISSLIAYMHMPLQ